MEQPPYALPVVIVPVPAEVASLHSDILRLIFSLLSLKELARCMGVCRRWRTLIDVDETWKRFLPPQANIDMRGSFPVKDLIWLYQAFHPRAISGCMDAIGKNTFSPVRHTRDPTAMNSIRLLCCFLTQREYFLLFAQPNLLPTSCVSRDIIAMVKRTIRRAVWLIIMLFVSLFFLLMLPSVSAVRRWPVWLRALLFAPSYGAAVAVSTHWQPDRFWWRVILLFFLPVTEVYLQPSLLYGPVSWRILYHLPLTAAAFWLIRFYFRNSRFQNDSLAKYIPFAGHWWTLAVPTIVFVEACEHVYAMVNVLSSMDYTVPW